ncbi:M48 family metalloprotease [Novosphingobium sp. G106]|uniref:M48 family metallopeptidase n=1 Tax=Novosphingobium sp. G106 TaxID=2849500 RepID=UPI001C2D6888|nr:M48 family metallopeptidase [Novosphingobium sp. G106]MBV1686605.1 M48 family metalloprotease [Novosphingobium sp. G106]
MARLETRGRLAAAMAMLALAQPAAAEPPAVPPTPAPAATAEYQLYQPQDADERGLWMTVDEAERSLRNSPSVIRDPALNAYVRGVLCKTVGADRCRNVRLYIVRTPQFNATMAPNGMMEVWSGLLLRTQNEAQLAAVLGHEYTHFEKRHTVKLFRDIKAKTDAASFLSLIPYAGIAGLAMVSSVFGFSRDMEREADTGGLAKMADAGYDTREAATVWERLREEMDATAVARNTKSRKDKNGGLFATHPPSAERVENLRAAAAANPGVAGANDAEAYRHALAPLWPAFVDDQLKLNDFGASEYLLTSLASAGWTPALLYARGELYRRRALPGDLEKAVGFYGEAVAAGGTMPELWRGRGMALQKLGQADAGRADLREYLRRAPSAPDKPMIAMLAGEGS